MQSVPATVYPSLQLAERPTTRKGFHGLQGLQVGDVLDTRSLGKSSNAKEHQCARVYIVEKVRTYF